MRINDSSGRPWYVDAILIPAGLGVFLTVVDIGRDWMQRGSRSISYAIVGPATVATIDNRGDVGSSYGKVLVELPDSAEQLGYGAYTVRVWNSGSEPLTNLQARIGFSEADTSAAIMAIRALTVPQVALSDVAFDSLGVGARRLNVALLNPGDEVRFVVVGRSRARLEFSARQEGLRVKRSSLLVSRSDALRCSFLFGLGAAIGALLSWILRARARAVPADDSRVTG